MDISKMVLDGASDRGAGFVQSFHTTLIYNTSKGAELEGKQQEFIRLCQNNTASGSLGSVVGSLSGGKKEVLRMSESLREAMERQLKERWQIDMLRKILQTSYDKMDYPALCEMLQGLDENTYMEACESLGLRPRWGYHTWNN